YVDAQHKGRRDVHPCASHMVGHGMAVRMTAGADVMHHTRVVGRDSAWVFPAALPSHWHAAIDRGMPLGYHDYRLGLPGANTGRDPCSLGAPMYRDSLVHRSLAPRESSRTHPRRSHAPGGDVTCQSHHTTNRFRNTRTPLLSASTTCAPAHPMKA